MDSTRYKPEAVHAAAEDVNKLSSTRKRGNDTHYGVIPGLTRDDVKKGGDDVVGAGILSGAVLDTREHAQHFE